jgi:tRNA-specific 2-thiouridylase
VARKDMAANTLYVVQGHDHPWLQSCALRAQDAHWIAGTPHAHSLASSGALLSAKTRYRQSDAPCVLHTDPADATHCSVVFPAPQWAVTPGQSAVLYQGEVCLGGGVIASAATAYRPERTVMPVRTVDR